MVDDARYLMKNWIETYDVPANITKDDGVSLAKYIVCFGKPDYPLDLVFFGTHLIDGIYSCGSPNSTALMDTDHSIYAYRELAPIDILTVDKVGVTGTKLHQTMEVELRRILETYRQSTPAGLSIRDLSRTTPKERDMGGWRLYNVRYVVDYVRDTS